MIVEKIKTDDQYSSQLRNLVNQPQWEAVSHEEGPLLVLAGAGSGKTRVITFRICYLIQKLGISPSNIIALTFTNKAASEMKKRVEELIGSRARTMWISTFHSACVRILRRHINKIDIPNNFLIFDADDQLKIMKQCFKDAKVDVKSINPSAVLSAISRAKNDLIGLDEYQKKAKTFFELKVSGFYLLYEKALRHNSALDFDDLIFMTVRLFRKHNDILEYYQNKWKFIMVDEYQDTNLSQSALLDLLAARNQNLFVVGDDDQSIYKWRGAEVKNILFFEKRYPHAHIIRLEQNYRSTQKILKAAEAVIEKNYHRKGKQLWTGNEPGELIELYTADDEHSEASYISQTILGLCKEEFKKYKDFCILYRVNAQSRVLEEELRKYNIPYVIVGSIRFYERKEIKDCMSYLRLINNSKDDVSLLRIINSPPRGIGKVTVDKLIAISQEEGISLFNSIEKALDEDIFPTQIYTALEVFYLLIKDLQEMASKSTATQILERMLDETKYLSFIGKEQNKEALARVENVKELISATKDFETESGVYTLSAFLDHVALLSDIDSYKEDEGAVILMTLHSAKGLEFPVVFITGMEQKIFPHEKAISSLEDLEEERRLCYVGMTRAKKRLYMTNAKERNIFGNIQHNSPSVFLKDIPADCLRTEHIPFFAESAPGLSVFRTSKGAASIYQSRQVPPISKPSGILSLSKPEKRHPLKYKPKKKLEPELEPVDLIFSGRKAAPEELVTGAVVFHSQWGKGRILQTEGMGDIMKALVDFRGHKKKLMVRYANLMIET